MLLIFLAYFISKELLLELFSLIVRHQCCYSKNDEALFSSLSYDTRTPIISVTIRPHFGGGHVFLFDHKQFVLRGHQKCSNVLRFGIMNSENMSNHFSTKNFAKFQCKQRLADVMTFFSALVFFWGQKNGHLRT